MVRGGSANVTSVVHKSGRALDWPNGAKRSICWTAWSVNALSGASASMANSPSRGVAPNFGGGRFAKSRAKAGQFAFLDLQTGRSRMAAVGNQEFIARGQGRVQVEARHAAGGADRRA